MVEAISIFIHTSYLLINHLNINEEDISPPRKLECGRMWGIVPTNKQEVYTRVGLLTKNKVTQII